jgi:hypothetical protein
MVELSQNSSVIIETFCFMICPEIQSRLGRISQQLSTLALESKQPLAEWVTGLFPGGKRSGCVLDLSQRQGPRLFLGFQSRLEGEFYLLLPFTSIHYMYYSSELQHLTIHSVIRPAVVQSSVCNSFAELRGNFVPTNWFMSGWLTAAY